MESETSRLRIGQKLKQDLNRVTEAYHGYTRGAARLEAERGIRYRIKEMEAELAQKERASAHAGNPDSKESVEQAPNRNQKGPARVAKVPLPETPESALPHKPEVPEVSEGMFEDTHKDIRGTQDEVNPSN